MLYLTIHVEPFRPGGGYGYIGSCRSPTQYVGDNLPTPWPIHGSIATVPNGLSVHTANW